jgi:hypothetical protein
MTNGSVGTFVVSRFDLTVLFCFYGGSLISSSFGKIFGGYADIFKSPIYCLSPSS